MDRSLVLTGLGWGWSPPCRDPVLRVHCISIITLPALLEIKGLVFFISNPHLKVLVDSASWTPGKVVQAGLSSGLVPPIVQGKRGQRGEREGGLRKGSGERRQSRRAQPGSDPFATPLAQTLWPLPNLPGQSENPRSKSWQRPFGGSQRSSNFPALPRPP